MGGASFVWSKIWKTKEVIKKRFRWVVKDMRDIDVYGDQWLRGKPDFRIEHDHKNSFKSAMVYEFFKYNAKD